MALSHGAKHEPAMQLLGQCSDGKVVPQFENGMGSRAWLRLRVRGEEGPEFLPDGLVQLDQAAQLQ
jgi:hypothetical protein